MEMIEKPSKARLARLEIALTEAEWGVVKEAAEKLGTTHTQLGKTALLDYLQRDGTKKAHEAIEIDRLKKIFCRSMDLSLRGKLTAERFSALVERVEDE